MTSEDPGIGPAQDPVQDEPRPLKAPRRFTFALAWLTAIAIVAIFAFIARQRLDDRPLAAGTVLPQTLRSDELNVTIRRSGEVLLVEMILTTEGPRAIAVQWDADAVARAGAASLADTDASHRAMFLLTSPGQRAGVALDVHPAARSTELRFSVDGDEVLRTDVTFEGWHTR